MNRLARHVLAWSLLMGTVGAVAQTASTQAAARRVDFNIAAQPMGRALNEFATQADMRIVFYPEVVAGLTAAKLVGSYSPQEALRILLADSDLRYKFTDARTVRIATPANLEHADSISDEGAQPTQMMLLAHADSSAADAAQAQSTSEDKQNSARAPEGVQEGRLEEIIVTAQKRSERLQDVPVPVTAIVAGSLTESNQLRIQDYYTKVPGLNLTVGDEFGLPQLAIRGITTGGFTSPTVGIVVDDVPYGSPATPWGFQAPDIDPADLARVEVLRGPQGTLYGASSLGGLLKFVTVEPSTDRVKGSLQAGLNGVHDSNDAGFGVRGSVNVPLGDTFAVRVSGFTRRDPGYMDNVRDGEKDVNWGDAYGGRFSALWRPSDTFSMKLDALIQRSVVHGSPSVELGLGLGDLEHDEVPGTGWRHNKLETYSATIKARLGGVDLTSITGYGINTMGDVYDFSSRYGQNITLPLAGVTGTALTADFQAANFTQEIRFAGTMGPRFEWLAGLFYSHEDSDDFKQTVLAEQPATGAFVADLGSFLGEGSDRLYRKFEEYAAFANLTVHFTERFDVQFGARQSRNEQEAPSVTVTGQIASLFYGTSPSIRPAASSKDDSLTYLVAPRFKVSPDLMVYARFASGYRPGGSNPPLPGINPQFDPDTTQNYELGLKGDFLNHLLSFDASVFYIDWTDIPIELRQPLTNLLYRANAGQAKSQGVELAMESRPLTGMTIAGWVAWNEAEITDVPATRTAFMDPGDRLPLSSRFSGNLSLDQEFPLTATMTGFAGASVSYVGDRESVFLTTPGRQNFPAYTKADLRAGVRFQDWTVNLFMNNVTDKRGLLAGGPGTLNTAAYYLIQPRSYGLSVSRTF